MARKPKTEKTVSAVPIDYIQIVEDLNDQAFQFCVEYLYPLLNYQVLKQSDMRRVDLEERLVVYGNTIPRDENGQKQGALNHYFFVLKLYFNDFLKCKPGTKAEKYRNRAIELMDHALSEEGSIEDIEDVVQIYIALFRALADDLDHIEKYSIIGLTFDVFKEDADLLNRIREHKKIVPSGIVVKQDIFDKIFGSDYEINAAIKFAYMNSILILCRCLQKRGAFAMEDE